MIIIHDRIKPFNRVKELIDNRYGYMAFIQYDDIVDTYLLIDLKDSTLKELAYYMLISFDIRLIDNSNLRILPLIDTSININQSIIYDKCNALNIHLLNDSSYIY